MEKPYWQVFSSLLSGFSSIFFIASVSLGSPRDETMREIIQATAIAAGIPPLLMLTICTVESSLIPHAKNGDARGICQVKPIAAEQVLGYRPTYRDLEEPSFNSYLGASYLRYCHQRFGSWPQALDCYYQGPEEVGELHHSRLYLKGSYVQKVCLRWRTLEIKRKLHENLSSPLHLC